MDIILRVALGWHSLKLVEVLRCHGDATRSKLFKRRRVNEALVWFLKFERVAKSRGNFGYRHSGLNHHCIAEVADNLNDASLS